jgi:hypothetical protein
MHIRFAALQFEGRPKKERFTELNEASTTFEVAMRTFLIGVRDFVAASSFFALLFAGGVFAVQAIDRATTPVCRDAGYKLQYRMCVNKAGDIKHPIFVNARTMPRP